MSKFIVVATVTLCSSITVIGQGYFAYEDPVERLVYAPALNDSVKFELIRPKAALLSHGVKYPVIVVFDRQNKHLYANTIHTIDFLTISSAIPNSIIIGITLDQQQRNLWTLPKHRNGKAEDFMDFLVDDLIDGSEALDVDHFILLVGHSRTAIFSSYAISRRYDKINGVFGASIACFDFGDHVQKKQFEAFLHDLRGLKRSFKYYFSAGDSVSGDLHEDDVMKLNRYLQTADLPMNFQYQMYHEKNSNHFTNYGLAVGKALNDVFVEYRQVLTACFKVLGDEKNIVALPWDDFESVFEKYESTTGARYYPDLTFYNSIASYISYGQNVAEKERNKLLADVLRKAMMHFPVYDGFYSWAARIQIRENNTEGAREYLKKALELLAQNPYLSDSEKANKRAQLQRELDDIVAE